MDTTIEELKQIMSELIISISSKISDNNYRYAYVDGILDFYNRLKEKIEKRG